MMTGYCSDSVFSDDKEEIVQDAEVSSSTLMFDDVLGGVAADEGAADALCLCG